MADAVHDHTVAGPMAQPGGTPAQPLAGATGPLRVKLEPVEEDQTETMDVAEGEDEEEEDPASEEELKKQLRSARAMLKILRSNRNAYTDAKLAEVEMKH